MHPIANPKNPSAAFLAFLGALLLAVHPAFSKEESEAIKLESKDGKTISAVILSVGKTSVRVRKDDGKEFEIPLSRLTEKSVDAARKAIEKKAEPEKDKGDPPPKTLPPIKQDAKHPKGVNTKLMSEDPTYGYTNENPILVGTKEEFGGPKAERAYLDSLLDAKGERISYERLASSSKLSPHNNVVDMYEVTTADGTKVLLFIDMYHEKKDPAKQAAPVGFYKKR